MCFTLKRKARTAALEDGRRKRGCRLICGGAKRGVAEASKNRARQRVKKGGRGSEANFRHTA